MTKNTGPPKDALWLYILLIAVVACDFLLVAVLFKFIGYFLTPHQVHATAIPPSGYTNGKPGEFLVPFGQ